MHCLSYFSILYLMVGAGSCFNATTIQDDGKMARIIGGTAVGIKRVPFLVSLRHKINNTTPFEHRCSGTIYSDSVVLTTATCVIGMEPHRLQVVAGTSYRTQNDGYVYLVEKYIIHPDFNIWFTNNDLALVHLAFELIKSSPSTVTPIALAKQLPMPGVEASIAGWGATSVNFSPTEQLQWVEVSVVAEAQCKLSYGENRITKAMICAGSDAHQIDACIGDAGGALVINREVVGLVSWCNGCGYKNMPGVYTNLVYFKQWIEHEVSKL